MKAMITGATSGIGRSTAELLLLEGYQVVIVGRRSDRLQELAQRYEGRAIAEAVDLSDQQAVLDLARRHLDTEVLVNNAGGALGFDPAYQADLNDWMAMIAINITQLVALTHELLPPMVERGHGTIVNVGSVAGEFPYPNGNVYGACKSFVRQFTLNLRADLAGTGVRVTDVEPGLVGDTEFSLVRFKGDHEAAKSVYEGTKPLTPSDIAEVIAFVLKQPAHVNINTISLMPTDQGFGAFSVKRSG
jgi:NADP-dependent 3-hydroxy acid dehydrogenase YdfG